MAEKTHGVMAPSPEKGAYIMQEPKGIPDIILMGGITAQIKLLSVLRELSVRGYTARIVTITDIKVFLKQDCYYQKYVFSPKIKARIGVYDTSEDLESVKKICPKLLSCNVPVSEIVSSALSELTASRTL